MHIRRFHIDDAQAVSDLIAKTLRTTNIRDYSAEHIEEDVKRLTPEYLIAQAEGRHSYTVIEDDRIVSCGTIGSYWGIEGESSLFTIFVLPEYQGRGIGRRIIETLEQDELFLNSRRIEIPASITATPFYRKMGYDYKNGITEPDGERLIRLEKFRYRIDMEPTPTAILQ